MIINIRGTSGSGKSHIVREIMAAYETRVNYKIEGRKRPIGYICGRKGKKSLAVIGHYEVPCGGCDTIPTLDQIFDLVRLCDETGYDVLFEGLLLNSDRNRTVQLHKDISGFTVISLSTPIEVCLSSIMERRRKKAMRLGKPVLPLKARNTEVKYKLAEKNHRMFSETGMDAKWMDRRLAWLTIRRLLDL